MRQALFDVMTDENMETQSTKDVTVDHADSINMELDLSRFGSVDRTLAGVRDHGFNSSQ